MGLCPLLFFSLCSLAFSVTHSYCDVLCHPSHKAARPSDHDEISETVSQSKRLLLYIDYLRYFVTGRRRGGGFTLTKAALPIYFLVFIHLGGARAPFLDCASPYIHFSLSSQFWLLLGFSHFQVNV